MQLYQYQLYVPTPSNVSNAVCVFERVFCKLYNIRHIEQNISDINMLHMDVVYTRKINSFCFMFLIKVTCLNKSLQCVTLHACSIISNTFLLNCAVWPTIDYVEPQHAVPNFQQTFGIYIILQMHAQIKICHLQSISGSCK